MKRNIIISLVFILFSIIISTSDISANKQKASENSIEYLYKAVQLLNSIGGAGAVDSVSVEYLLKINTENIRVKIPKDRNIKLENSIKYLNRALKISPEFNEAHHFLGVAYLLKSDITNAVKSLESATHLNVKKESAYYYLFMLYPKLGKFSEGHKLVNKFKVLFPNSAYKGDLYNATIYFNEKRYRKAITIAKLIFEKYPNEISSLYIIGNSHLMLFEDKEANDYYSQIIKISPDQKFQVQNTKEKLLNKRKNSIKTTK